MNLSILAGLGFSHIKHLPTCKTQKIKRFTFSALVKGSSTTVISEGPRSPAVPAVGAPVWYFRSCEGFIENEKNAKSCKTA
jgi:hypothetical protein